MEKALVTGANGFIGSALTRRLLRDGYAVRALCRSVERGAQLSADGAEVIKGDVQDPASLRNSADGCDVVFHVAAVGDGSAAYQYSINVQGTLNIARAAHKANIKRFVHVSSVAVYGYKLSGIIDETHPQRPSPKDFYMQTKSTGEQALVRFSQGVNMPTVVIRPAFVYGPGSGMWSGAMYDIVSRIPTPLIGGGYGNAHPIFVGDVVDLLITAATHPDAPGHIFHAAPDPAPSWAEFLSYYARIAGRTTTISVPVPTRNIYKQIADFGSVMGRLTGSPFDIYGALQYLTRDVTFSMEHAEKVLNWRPRISLAQGMVLTEPWLRDRAKVSHVQIGT